MDRSVDPLPRSHLYAAVALFAVIGFLVYGSSLDNHFVNWDDTYVIFFNPAIKAINLTTLKTIFTTFDPELYIPVTLFTYQIDHLIGRLDPFMYHFTSLLLHIANALLVAWIGYRLSGKSLVGFLTGLLFAVHPLQVEAVAWASARKDVLSTFFFLGSLSLYLRYRETGGRRPYLLSLFAFFLGLLSKVMVLTLPIILLLLDYRDHRRIDRRMLLEKLPFFVLSIVLGIVALFGKRDVTAAATIWETILMAARSTTFYLQKLVWPSELVVIYPFNEPLAVTTPVIAGSLAALACLLVIVLLLARRNREVGFAFGFFFVTLIPTFINFVKGEDFYFASDRYAYIPSIGLFFLASLGIQALASLPLRHGDRSRLRMGLGAVCAAILLAFAFLAHRQSLIWTNSTSLFSWNLRHYPDAIAARINLARVHREFDHNEEARAELMAALRIREHARVYANLAALESAEGKREEAFRLYQKAYEVNQQDPAGLVGMAIMRAEEKKYDEALAFYERALALDENFVGIYNNLGAMFLEQGNMQEAEKYFRIAVEKDPFYPDAHYNLGIVLQERGDIDGAIAAFEMVLLSRPRRDADALIFLAKLYLQKQRWDDAVAMAMQALQEETIPPEAPAIALDVVKKTIAADPEHAGARELLDLLFAKGHVQRRSQGGTGPL